MQPPAPAEEHMQPPEGGEVELAQTNLPEDAPALRFFTCPRDWTPYKTNCYKLMTTPTSWTNAERQCSDYGAVLAPVDNFGDYSFMQSYINGQGGGEAWLGGFYFKRWRWLDNSLFDINPPYDTYRQCISLHGAVLKDDVPAPEEEDAAAEMAAPAGVRFFTCPSGWVRYKHSCYLYVTSPQSWSNAEAHCDRLGASLASGHDAFDYTFLQSLTKKASSVAAWTGGYFFLQNFRWVDQSRFSYHNWSPQLRPDMNPCLFVQAMENGWGNGDCGTLRHSICMRRIDTC
ncbi:putative ladderlectin-like [Xyrichtys novacula]|uniref:Ladderlectin-like n=1 Tax=Xyrichtys novacula TaxID=13765 RepID=A0AAV1FA79_XYRNO|nr:putative ladderlectin-like [Xyrichtys novacula]